MFSFNYHAFNYHAFKMLFYSYAAHSQKMVSFGSFNQALLANVRAQHHAGQNIMSVNGTVTLMLWPIPVTLMILICLQFHPM